MRPSKYIHMHAHSHTHTQIYTHIGMHAHAHTNTHSEACYIYGFVSTVYNILPCASFVLKNVFIHSSCHYNIRCCFTPDHHINTLLSTIPLMPCHLSAPYTYGILYSLSAICMAQLIFPGRQWIRSLIKLSKAIIKNSIIT